MGDEVIFGIPPISKKSYQTISISRILQGDGLKRSLFENDLLHHVKNAWRISLKASRFTYYDYLVDYL